ncbi:MAG: type II toxin-antitoxin system PemK/MazF family toxin [Acidobacteriota bacterium]|nr:MAG: type II toxin-antitoxin system PemK/MazF family toxin [Acidobacteriota bacterium]
MAKRQKITYPRRGEIYLVDFEPTRGAEIKKTRPSLIIQNDTGNRYSPITIVAAITSQVGGRIYLTEVFVKAPEGGLTSDGLVLLNQIRSIDKGRLVKRLGTITPQTMQRVEDALRISMEL